MRIRLRLLLPLLAGALVAAAFVVAAAVVGDGIHDSLTTVPGLTRERTVERAVATLTLIGIVATGVAVLIGLLVAALVVRPLSRMRRAADRLSRPVEEPQTDTPVAEIQDLARAIDRAAGELRDRHAMELRERTELAALVDAVSEGIIQVGPDGRVARMNPASRALLGLPVDSLGRPVQALFRHAELRELMARGARGREPEVAELVLDDMRVLVAISGQAGGGAVATFVDLTDLRRLEEVRRDFVANASHELKTPLTSIRGYTETLLDGDLPDTERQQFLVTIARNAERLQRIVDDLLDLSRLEAGRWKPELEPVHVVKAAESCWLAFADRAADQGVGFAAEAQDGDLAVADRRGLEQVFANLYDNALRYTPEHGRIRVTAAPDPSGPEREAQRRPGDTLAAGNGGPTAREPDHPGWLRIEVSDTGTGIPRDALPRIFERFYRVDPARSRAEGGTGLGLSIVKHMVESMGGAVRADSALGKGTTVRLWLPRG